MQMIIDRSTRGVTATERTALNEAERTARDVFPGASKNSIAIAASLLMLAADHGAALQRIDTLEEQVSRLQKLVERLDSELTTTRTHLNETAIGCGE